AARLPRRPALSRHRFHLPNRFHRIRRHAREELLPRPGLSDVICRGRRCFREDFRAAHALAQTGDCVSRRRVSGHLRTGRSPHFITGEIARLYARDSFRGPTNGNVACCGITPTLCRPIRLGGDGALSCAVYASLPANEQQHAAIFCQNYGEAGAIDFFGPKYGLPPALSGHQNYFYWGPGNYTGAIMIVLDDDATDEREQFRSVEDRGMVESSPWAMPWEQRLHIFVCRDLKIPLRELWPKVRVWL